MKNFLSTYTQMFNDVFTRNYKGLFSFIWMITALDISKAIALHYVDGFFMLLLVGIPIFWGLLILPIALKVYLDK